MFRDQQQKAAVCKRLTDWIWHGDFWDVEKAKPINSAEYIAAWNGRDLRLHERLSFLFAWELWCGGTHLRIVELLEEHKPEYLAEIGTLISAIAAGPEQIDRWLDSPRFVEE